MKALVLNITWCVFFFWNLKKKKNNLLTICTVQTVVLPSKQWPKSFLQVFRTTWKGSLFDLEGKNCCQQTSMSACKCVTVHVSSLCWKKNNGVRLRNQNEPTAAISRETTCRCWVCPGATPLRRRCPVSFSWPRRTPPPAGPGTWSAAWACSGSGGTPASRCSLAASGCGSEAAAAQAGSRPGSPWSSLLAIGGSYCLTLWKRTARLVVFDKPSPCLDTCIFSAVCSQFIFLIWPAELQNIYY